MLQPCWVLAHLAAAHSIQHLPNLLHLLHALVKLELGSSNKSKPSSAASKLITSVPALCSELHGAGWAVSRALPMFYSALLH